MASAAGLPGRWGQNQFAGTLWAANNDGERIVRQKRPKTSSAPKVRVRHNPSKSSGYCKIFSRRSDSASEAHRTGAWCAPRLTGQVAGCAKH